MSLHRWIAKQNVMYWWHILSCSYKDIEMLRMGQPWMHAKRNTPGDQHSLCILIYRNYPEYTNQQRHEDLWLPKPEKRGLWEQQWVTLEHLLGVMKMFCNYMAAMRTEWWGVFSKSLTFSCVNCVSVTLLHYHKTKRKTLKTMPNLILTSLGAVEAFFSHSNHTANRQVDCYSCVRGRQTNKLYLNKQKDSDRRGKGEGREQFLSLWPLWSLWSSLLPFLGPSIQREKYRWRIWQRHDTIVRASPWTKG